MGDPKGFLTTARETPRRRPVDVRLTDWREVYEPFASERTERQAARCMDCGIPFCHNGCPLGNLIPEWNDLVYRSDWAAAADRLHATNNFPEFTGRLCPAPCETACVLGINADPVTIKQVEVEIIDRAWADGGVVPVIPETLTGFTVAVVGSGPSGLAAAQQLTRAGHQVTVFERDDAVGGLLRYGIPEFKMEKRHLDRRVAQMEAEGTRFVTGAPSRVGGAARGILRGRPRRRRAGRPRPAGAWPRPGRHPPGDGVPAPRQPARGGLAGQRRGQARRDHRRRRHRRGLPRHLAPPGGRVGDAAGDHAPAAEVQGATNQPWPTYPMIYRVSSAHEEGGERVYAVSTEEFVGDAERRGAGAAPDRGGLRGRPVRAGTRHPQGDTVRAWCCSRWASPAPRSPACSRTSAWTSTRAATWPATPPTRRRCPACSWPATWAAASR